MNSRQHEVTAHTYILLTCGHCGKRFRAAWWREDTARYCSRKCMGQGARRPLADRLWEKVDRSAGADGCWIWTGAKGARGYGRITVVEADGKKIAKNAHRVAWELTHGPLLKGQLVCHNCPGGDNPSCVNPAHMFIGSHKENMRDMAKKGRQAFQSSPEKIALSRASKLSEDDAREIRTLSDAGFPLQDIAERFGVHRLTVIDVVARKTWRHVT